MGFPTILEHSGVSVFNAIFESLALRSGHQLGFGIISGLTISGSDDTLEITIAPGVFAGLKAVTLPGPITGTVPAESTGFFWMDEAFATTTTPTLVSPGGTFGCLGGFESTDEGVSVNASGRCELARWVGNQFIIGAGDLKVVPGGGIESEGSIVSSVVVSAPQIAIPQVADAPAAIEGTSQVFSKIDDATGRAEVFLQDESGDSVQLTHGGQFRIANPKYIGPVKLPEVVATLTTDLEGTADDPNVLRLTPSGADRKYILPPPAIGINRIIINESSGSHNIVVRNPDDSATVAVLGSGASLEVSPVLNATTLVPDYGDHDTYSPNVRSAGETVSGSGSTMTGGGTGTGGDYGTCDVGDGVAYVMTESACIAAGGTWTP